VSSSERVRLIGKPNKLQIATKTVLGHRALHEASTLVRVNRPGNGGMIVGLVRIIYV
jgi:hypothetical protein